MKEITFWYEFASPYAYFSMMRIGDLCKAKGVEVVYQPFLLGPIFKQQGWHTSPFLIYEAKGKNFFRDIEREAEFYGLPPITILQDFPQSGVLATRLTLIGLQQGWGVDFSKAVYRRQFQDGLPIGGEEDLRGVLQKMDVGSVDDLLTQACGDEVKAQLWAISDQAKDIGIFGAPSFVVGDELFWGNDRLERAIEYACRA